MYKDTAGRTFRLNLLYRG